jgi:hypothetical protein
MLSRMTGLQLVFNDTQTRSIHLAFGVFLAFMAFSGPVQQPRATVFRYSTGFLGILAAFCALYIFIFYRPSPSAQACQSRRTLLPPGSAWFLPARGDTTSPRPAAGDRRPWSSWPMCSSVRRPSCLTSSAGVGASFARAMDQMWLSTGGGLRCCAGRFDGLRFPCSCWFGSMLEPCRRRQLLHQARFPRCWGTSRAALPRRPCWPR